MLHVPDLLLVAILAGSCPLGLGKKSAAPSHLKLSDFLQGKGVSNWGYVRRSPMPV